LLFLGGLGVLGGSKKIIYGGLRAASDSGGKPPHSRVRQFEFDGLNISMRHGDACSAAG